MSEAFALICLKVFKVYSAMNRAFQLSVFVKYRYRYYEYLIFCYS